MKALISPNEPVSQVTSWVLDENEYQPVYSVFGLRVAEIREIPFEVAEPLYWVDCPDTATIWDYYDPESNQFLQLPEPAPEPLQPQPIVNGVETL